MAPLCSLTVFVVPWLHDKVNRYFTNRVNQGVRNRSFANIRMASLRPRIAFHGGLTRESDPEGQNMPLKAGRPPEQAPLTEGAPAWIIVCPGATPQPARKCCTTSRGGKSTSDGNRFDNDVAREATFPSDRGGI
jgi:hypothetical protein